MSNYCEYVESRIKIDHLSPIIETIITDFDWFITEREENRFKIREKDRFDYFNPFEMELLMEISGKGSRLRVRARNNGEGPVQDEYIRSRVLKFLDQLRKKVDERVEEELSRSIVHNAKNLVDELERLAMLHQNGSLTEDEFHKAKEKIIEG